MECVVCNHQSETRVCPVCDVTVMPNLYYLWQQMTRRQSIVEEFQDYMVFRRFFFSVAKTDGSQFIRTKVPGEQMSPTNYTVVDQPTRRRKVMHGMSAHPWYQWWLKHRNTENLVKEWEDPRLALEEMEILSDGDRSLTPTAINSDERIGPDNVRFYVRASCEESERYQPQDVLNGKSIREAATLTNFTEDAVRVWTRQYTTFEGFKREHPIEAEKLED